MAYPDVSDFASSAPNASWFTNTQTRQVCSTNGGALIQRLHDRLRQVYAGEGFDRSLWDYITGNVGGLGSGTAAIPTNPAWTGATARYLFLAFYQWYGPQNPYTVALAQWLRSGSINRNALIAALWFAYLTGGGHVQSTPDGNRAERTRTPSEQVPIGAVEIKGDVILPVMDRTMTGQPGNLLCVAAPNMAPVSTVSLGPIGEVNTSTLLLAGAAAVVVALVWSQMGSGK